MFSKPGYISDQFFHKYYLLLEGACAPTFEYYGTDINKSRFPTTDPSFTEGTDKEKDFVYIYQRLAKTLLL